MPGRDRIEEPSSAGIREARMRALAALRLGQARTAEAEARAIQATAPDDLQSLWILGAALLDQDRTNEAIDPLERVVAAAPRFWAARTDLARAHRVAGRCDLAQRELRQVLAAAPAFEAAWRVYGDTWVDLGRYPEARGAYERARQCDPQARRIDEASAALAAEDRRRAERIFREILAGDPGHVGAVCGLAAVALAAGRAADALRLLQHATKQSPHLPLVMRGTAQALVDLGRLSDAERSLRRLLLIEPENPKNWVQLGNVYTRMMRQPEALAAFEEAARLNPGEVRLRLSIGHLHKTLGNRPACEAAYRECLARAPAMGEVYWALADLKTYVFSDAEIAAMQALLRADGDDVDQAHLRFALGRAFEHRREYATAFEHYASGNRRRRKTIAYDIRVFEAKTRRVRECFDAAFLAGRAGAGFEDPAPIFIVGLPRSGSTLVEQILASHSAVEGTFELPNVLTIVREFDHSDEAHDAYPEVVRAVPAGRFAELGRRYVEETRPLRSGAPRVIDKMPNNFSHVGLIHCILPQATSIDVRRHPMDACFSTFKQHFAEGQSFSYDLEDLGRYYRCYLDLMDHWDAVLPGKVLQLRYEHLVRDPERQIRRLLAHCGLEFEPACLAFHETKRAVRTASAEQVRQPLYSSGVGYWKHFASALDPLRRALGDCLDRFEREE